MRRFVVWAMGVGLVLRLAAAVHQSGAPILGDAEEYVGIARSIAERGEFSLKPGTPTACRPPLYPAFLSVFARACGESWTCARLAQAVIDTLSIFLLYWFGRLTSGDGRGAAAGAWLYALHPVFISYSVHMLTEVLFISVWLAFLCLLLEGLDERREGRKAFGALLGAGLAGGAAILCRANFIFFLPGAAVMLWVFHRGRSALPARLALVLAVGYAVVLPWSLRNARVMGRWITVATGGGGSVWTGAQLGPDIAGDVTRLTRQLAGAGRSELEIDDELYRLGRQALRKNAGALVIRWPGRFRAFWLTSHSAMVGIDRSVSEYRAEGRWGPIILRCALWALQLTLLLLAVWGLWSARGAWTMGCTLALAACAYYSLHVLVGWWTSRYHLPALAVLLAFSGAALARLPGVRAPACRSCG